MHQYFFSWIYVQKLHCHDTTSCTVDRLIVTGSCAPYGVGNYSIKSVGVLNSTGMEGSYVQVDLSGNFGVAGSTREIKKDIRPLDFHESECIYQMQPKILL
jgi:hypothetical protein